MGIPGPPAPDAPSHGPWALAPRSPVRFPRGIKFIADYVAKKGLQLGLYGGIGDSTCGGFIGFNVSATADARADAQLQLQRAEL